MATRGRGRILLTIIVLILGATGCLSGVIEDTSLGEQDIRSQCGQWAITDNIRATIRNVSRPMVCPCSEQLMQYDDTFRKTGPCYEEYFYQDGVKLVCCYSAAGDLNSQGKDRGYIMVERYDQEIKHFRELCCHDNDLCDLIHETLPLEECQHYKTPTVLKSWGDAHIQTVTGDKYDFNGLGEYIYLDVKGTFQIQCRLEYYSDTNNDATIFTAFAIRVKNDTWEVNLNRTSGELIYAPSSPVAQTVDREDGTLLVMLIGFRLPQIIVTGGDQISLSLPGRLPMDMDYKGLAGNSMDGFQLRNKSKIANNSRPIKIYDFGQSWKLTDQSESIFTYSSPDMNFTHYNRNAPRPNFPEDFLNNIPNMFHVFGNHTDEEIEEYTKLCNVSDDSVQNRCLVSIARTSKMEDANTIIKEYKRQLDISRLENVAKDHPPTFNATFPNDILVKLNLNETLTLKVSDYVTDNDTDEKFTYAVGANGNITYAIENGTITFYVDKNFRDYQGSITVIVTDKWGKSDTQPFKFSYCGCERPNQCGTVDDSTSTGDAPSMSVKQVHCDCNDYFTGSYCEIKRDVCNITQCYTGVRCNETVDLYDDSSNPCGPCPDGYSGDGIHCTDINECTTTGTSQCEQLCKNTVGNYTCSCNKGYTKEEEFRCKDIDECQNHSCTASHTVCVNYPGSYSCDCSEGFVMDSTGSLCSADNGKYVYYGSLNLTVNSCGVDAVIEDSTMKKMLYLLRPNDTDFANVELINRTITKISSQHKEYIVFELHSHDNLNWTYVQDRLDQEPSIEWHIISNDGHNCSVIGTKQLYTEADNLVCRIQDKNKCATTSTNCVQHNGESLCECKPGYERKPGPVNLCYDIKECEVYDKAYFQQHCVHGSCLNTQGSWNCSCPEGRHWMHFEDDTYRCQGNFSYFGQIQIDTSSPSLETKDNLTAFLDHLVLTQLKQNDGNLTDDGTPIYQMFVYSNIFELTNDSNTQNNSSGPWTVYTARFVLRFGEILSNLSIRSEALGDLSETNFTQLSNGVTPTDINMTIFTDEDNVICHSPFGNKCDMATTYCQSDKGDYMCPCRQGYKTYNGNKYTCTDRDECKDNFNCTNNGACRNTIGNWTCDCPTGFVTQYSAYDHVTCEDLDECQDNTTYVCRQGSCVNTHGSWNCSCNEGYQRGETYGNTKLCEDINECSTKNKTYFEEHCVHGKCTNSQGSWNCTCPDGTLWMKFEDNTYRCQGNFSYFGRMNVTSTTLHNVSLHDLNHYLYDVVFNSLKSLKPGNTDDNRSETDPPLYQLLVSSNIYNASNISTGTGAIYTAEFVLRFGDPLRDTKTLSEALSEPNVLNTTLSNGNKTTNTTIQIHTDEDNIICKPPFGNKCNTDSTSCRSLYGTYTCNCTEGYTSSDNDAYSCHDRNECKDNFNCTNGGTCNNLVGNWTCACPRGFVTHYWAYDKITCEDLDECQDNTTYVCHQGSCDNTHGSWNCSCNEGYQRGETFGNSKLCENIDECSAYKATYFEEHCVHGTCSDSQGSWNCSCPNGTVWMKFEDNKYRCQGNFSYFGQIQINTSSTSLASKEMLTSFLDNLVLTQLKQNNGSLTDDGSPIYQLFAYSNIFQMANKSYKQENSSDTWTVYTARFVLRFGERLSNLSILSKALGDLSDTNFTQLLNGVKPTDINVSMFTDKDNLICQAPFGNKCDIDTTYCQSDKGGYSCPCKQGYQNVTGNEYICTDRDECNDNFSCTNNGACRNTNGNWTCDCPTGFVTQYWTYDHITCEDIDECLDNTTYVCHHGSCDNTHGSWNCSCSEGYQPATPHGNDKSCKDIDECDSGFTCSNGGRCNNTDGSWTCECPEGFSTKRNNSYVTCEDLNECDDSETNNCTNTSTCQNSHGSWECLCNTGYQKNSDSLLCEDVNECDTNIPDSCTSTNGTCDNLEGNWTCNCSAGFRTAYHQYDKVTCEDIDECYEYGECVNGHCTNTDGGFGCECPTDLNSKGTNGSGITVCRGSNHYQCKMTMNSTKLNETEKKIIEERLEIEIRLIYIEKFGDVSVTVIVTLVQVNATPTRKKRDTSSPSTFQYAATADTYFNETKDHDVMVDILENKTDSLTKAIANVSSHDIFIDEHSVKIKTITTTTTTPVPTTPSCDKPCENGGTCVWTGDSKQTCGCPATFTGVVCEVEIQKQTDDKDKDTIIYASVGSLGGLVVILAIVIIIVCRVASSRKKRQHKSNSMYMDIDTTSNKGNTVEMYRGSLYLPEQEETNIDDHASNGTNRYRIPRLDRRSISEPNPDYDPPSTYDNFQIPQQGIPKPDYNRPRSPKPDYKHAGTDNRGFHDVPRISVSSRDSGMDISRGSISMEKHLRNNSADNALYSHVDKRSHRVMSNHL